MRTHSALRLLMLFVLAWVAPTAAGAEPNRELDFETVFEGRVLGGLRLTGDYVFRDKQSWCRFWGQLVRGMIPPPPCAPVDFRHEVAIASVATGACSELEIQSIERAGSRRAVSVLVQSRVDPCPLLVVLDWGHAVVVSRRIGDVEFVHETIPLDGSPGR